MEVVKVVKVLKKNGWRIDRQNGSHIIFVKDGKICVVPNYKGDLKKGTLASIERSAGLKF